MVLTAASLAHYLLERGLVGSSTLVDGDFRVRDLSRRNRVFRVLRGSHPGYIVKQVKDWKPHPIETLEREAGFYSLLRSEPRLAPLQRFLPKCYAYDAENQVLVFEPAMENGESSFLSLETARFLGEALRQWHQEARAAADQLRDFHEYDPWVLSFHLKSIDDFDSSESGGERRRDGASGEANAELLRIVKRDTAFGRALEALRAQWQADTLIHGDMKWDNCLMATDAGTNVTVRFIDWEMAGWGDPLWDVAGLLQGYLISWARRSRSAEEVEPAMRALWESYGADAGSLSRAVGYAAARMIQSAFEHQSREKQMTALAVRLLQAASNILAAPDQAVALFFGTA
jgi:aminoglycoside phosphotransferase (APT) family kinase protein